ncbi:MAG TPA: type VI secretion system protein TssA, partial [Thermodesulfobacteriaceae bacterium]|nr:type VI secretion system protein TssA [Thermodesulfobacteriaceae bacterium]
MSSIDVEKLLKKISEKMPSGANLEYDPALQVLEQAAITKPVKEFGDTVVLAEEPDWDKVKML